MKFYLPAYEKSDPKNYILALKESRSGFSEKEPQRMAKNSGGTYIEGKIHIKVLGHNISVIHPQGFVKFSENTDLEPHFILQLIIINYLARSGGEPLTYEFLPYRDFPGGNAFYAAFYQSAIQPLAQNFGRNPERLQALASNLGGEVMETGSSTQILFRFLPRVLLKYIVWPGDEEISAQANVLFDSSAGDYLHTEDLAGAGAYLTELLVEQAGKIYS